ncbi:MAG: AraC family transcriptional regulator [Bacteroidetes bacterium]|nr:MAG: AraC family transcriptional regulator [Bacteroidota bacterium]
MEHIEKLEEFYQRKFDWMPEGIRNEIGHFNVFKLEPFVGEKARPVPYKKRDFYKITLLTGHSKVHFADKVIEVQKQALVFSNPQIPYKWEHTAQIRSGFFCIFNQHFFHQYGKLSQYSVFQPGASHVFELSDEQVSQASAVYERMFAEINSDYIHKYDVLRNLVFELLHFAMKLQPSSTFDKQTLNASQRISTLFLELLERQFPIDDTHQSLDLRSASDFAAQLHVHVNHLNRVVKEVTHKTTTQLISERILQESKILLRHSAWSAAEIAYALGFKEVTHFHNFFKKHTGCSPLKFRQAPVS